MAYIETPNLPTNAAQESGGNLAAIASGLGTGGTGISPPSGGSGILGFLSGIYSRLASTLSVTITGTPNVSVTNNPVLGAGTNNIGIVTPYYLAPLSWNGITAYDMRKYSTVIITCTVAPATPYQITVSPDNNSDFIPQTVVVNNSSGITTTNTISTTGTFSLSGRQFVQLTGGSTGTFFIAGGQ